MEIQFTLRLRSLQCLRLAVCYKYAIRSRIRIFVSRFRLPHYFRGLYKQPPLLRSKHSCSMCLCVCVCAAFLAYSQRRNIVTTHTYTHSNTRYICLCVCVCIEHRSRSVRYFDERTIYAIFIYKLTWISHPVCVCVCVRACMCANICIGLCVCECVCVFHSLADSMCIILQTLHKARAWSRGRGEICRMLESMLWNMQSCILQ